MNKILFLIFLFCIILSITSYAQDSEWANVCEKTSAGDYRGALSDLDNYIEKYPNYCSFYQSRAFCKEQLNDYSGAYEDWAIFRKKADWRQNCDWVKSLLPMARLLLIMNQLPEAIATFNELSATAPHYFHEDAYYYRGITKYLLKDYKGAIADFNNIPTNSIKFFPFTLNTRGFAKFETYDYSGAQEDFEDYLSMGPSAVAYYGRGLLNMRTNFKAAISDFDNAISIFPSVSFTGLWKTLFGEYFSLSYTCRAECKYMLADLPGAIEDYSKAITLSPNYAPNYAGRGLARTKENYSDKIQDYNKAIQLDPGNPNYYHYRSQAKYDRGDKDGACQDFRKARELGLSATYHFMDKLCK